MFTEYEKKLVLATLLLLVPITGGLLATGLLQIQEDRQFSNEVNGYVAPKWLGSQIEESQKSIVTVTCSESSGSGFSFDLDETDIGYGFSFQPLTKTGNTSVVITNAHVVEQCDSSNARITTADNQIDYAEIVLIDNQNDLALLKTDLVIPPLYGAYFAPRTGYWVMAVGSPHNFAGSVTFGNIINRDGDQIFTTASLSPGNSGGPLIENAGFVYGVNTGAKPVGQNFNVSVSINAFCSKLIVCPKGRFSE